MALATTPLPRGPVNPFAPEEQTEEALRALPRPPPGTGEYHQQNLKAENRGTTPVSGGGRTQRRDDHSKKGAADYSHFGELTQKKGQTEESDGQSAESLINSDGRSDAHCSAQTERRGAFTWIAKWF